MIFAMFKIMWLRLWRDKGAFILAFVLPGFIFAIFAAIFSNASGGNLDIRISMAVTTQAPSSIELAQAIERKAEFTLTTRPEWTGDDVRSRVRLGQDDAGIIIMENLSSASSPPIMIIKDPSREVAATVLMGQIRQILADTQAAQLGEGVNTKPPLFAVSTAMETDAQSAVDDPSVTYYIGATAILFLLFSAMQGASLTLEERKSGISDRLLVGPGGALKLLGGKFLFLTLIGTLQAGVILLVAHIFFHVPIIPIIAPLVLACLGSAALASGFALFIASVSGSTAQMNTISTFVVLLFSAVGGSMVPRFMMPEWLQSVGVFTPNHWSIEAFYGILARGQTISDLIYVWGILFGGAALCVLLAAMTSQLLMRS